MAKQDKDKQTLYTKQHKQSKSEQHQPNFMNLHETNTIDLINHVSTEELKKTLNI